MECPTIEGLVFDQKSLDGIALLKRKRELANMAANALSLGTVVNLLLGRSNSLTTANSIRSHDWVMYANSMRTIPDAGRRVIKVNAQMQELDHLNDSKQRLFWKAVAEGCHVK